VVAAGAAVAAAVAAGVAGFAPVPVVFASARLAGTGSPTSRALRVLT
jgi:hypothetical protein